MQIPNLDQNQSGGRARSTGEGGMTQYFFTLFVLSLLTASIFI